MQEKEKKNLPELILFQLDSSSVLWKYWLAILLLAGYRHRLGGGSSAISGSRDGSICLWLSRSRQLAHGLPQLLGLAQRCQSEQHVRPWLLGECLSPPLPPCEWGSTHGSKFEKPAQGPPRHGDRMPEGWTNSGFPCFIAVNSLLCLRQFKLGFLLLAAVRDALGLSDLKYYYYPDSVKFNLHILGT